MLHTETEPTTRRAALVHHHDGDLQNRHETHENASRAHESAAVPNAILSDSKPFQNAHGSSTDPERSESSRSGLSTKSDACNLSGNLVVNPLS